MAFSDTQARQLKAKLDSQHVKARKENGATLHYIEGWHAIAEANRIFGYDAWDRRTVATRCVWTEARGIAVPRRLYRESPHKCKGQRYCHRARGLWHLRGQSIKSRTSP
jgi:hypothetical protein